MQSNVSILFYTIPLLLSTCSFQPVKDINGGFTHGVASGDPSKNSIVLWTRYDPSTGADAELTFEIAQDEAFKTIIKSGNVTAEIENDYCVKAIVSQLTPGSNFYYRFSKGDIISAVGQTRTLPEKVDHIKIGVVNCAKYTGGYYHAYEALSNMDSIDAVIHLGDYIYENGPSTPESSYWAAYEATGRQHNPPHHCISLQDYRTRYAQYRSDTSLQKLHARFPMIPIWDDHEIAMSKEVKDESGNKIKNDHWEERRDNSIKAYHEWLPLRPNSFDEIYRSFQFGDLVNLLMLDTRVCCRSAVTKTEESLLDTSRHIIGNKQLDWIFDEIERHNSQWNVFGNQILISEKGKGWNRWQGFPHDRNRFLNFVRNNPTENFVFTTGNAHNPHHYVVFDSENKDTLLHEFLPGAVSSGNNAEKARFDPEILAKEEKRLIEADNVLWFDQNAHGFIVLDISAESLIAQWYFVSTIWEDSFELTQPYSVTLQSKKE